MRTDAITTATISNSNEGDTITTNVDYNFNRDQLVDVKITENGVEVTYQQASNMVHLIYPSQYAPDIVWKDVYKIKDNKLLFDKKIYGKHTPAYSVAEEITFEDEE